MKKFIFGAMALFLSASVAFAQAPRQFSYQTVVRNSSNALVANSNVGIRISILKTSATGASQYSERHTVTTNANGLASLTIGTGTQTTGSLANIEWISDAFFVKTEVDPAGGTNYSITGTSQLLAAPYALNGFMPGPFNDPTFKGGGGGWTRIGGKNGLQFWANDSVTLNDRPQLGLSSDNKLELRGAGASFTVGTRALGDGAVWLGNANHGIKRTNNDVTIQTLGGGNSGMIIFANGGAATPTERMRIFHNGNVGIGTANPSALLHVQGSASYNFGNFAFYALQNGQPWTGGAPALNAGVSIYGSERIVGQQFNAFSDIRMKNVIGKSNSSTDLKILMNISVTDYTHKDVVTRGKGVVKKVIAQEVEKVYPNSVTKITEVIPDILALATVKDGIVSVKNSLKAGDKVRLVFEKETVLLDVLEANASSFKVQTTNQGQVFVYGKQVDDFRTVDYEALSTLNISATQELAKKVAALEAENARLQIENKEVKTSLNTFQTQLEAIQAKLEVLVPAETAKK